MIVILVAVGLTVGGFFAFVGQVERQASPITDQPKADAIVVLTGGRARLDAAVGLLAEGSGERLLISGVHSDISEAALREALGVSQRLYDCCIDIDREALDTTGNATGSARWARDNGYSSLIIVTNDYHVPRSMLEMRRTLPELVLTAYPVVNESGSASDLTALVDRYRVLVGEYAKYLVAYARAPISRPNLAFHAAN